MSMVLFCTIFLDLLLPVQMPDISGWFHSFIFRKMKNKLVSNKKKIHNFITSDIEIYEEVWVLHQYVQY